MTDKYQALREAAAKATPGPWRFDGEVVASDRGVVTRSPRITERCAPGGMSDAHYISAASPDVISSLLSALDAAEAKAEKAERERDEARTNLEAAQHTRELRPTICAECGKAGKWCPWRCPERGYVCAQCLHDEAVALRADLATVEHVRAEERAAWMAEVKRLREAMPVSDGEWDEYEQIVDALNVADHANNARGVYRKAFAWLTRLDAARGGSNG